MDGNRQKNNNTTRSIKYIIFYQKPNGKKAKTSTVGSKVGKVCEGLEKNKFTILEVIPDVNIKE